MMRALLLVHVLGMLIAVWLANAAAAPQFICVRRLPYPLLFYAPRHKKQLNP